jgi:hypothetical protein
MKIPNKKKIRKYRSCTGWDRVLFGAIACPEPSEIHKQMYSY